MIGATKWTYRTGNMSQIDFVLQRLAAKTVEKSLNIIELDASSTDRNNSAYNR